LKKDTRSFPLHIIITFDDKKLFRQPVCTNSILNPCIQLFPYCYLILICHIRDITVAAEMCLPSRCPATGLHVTISTKTNLVGISGLLNQRKIHSTNFLCSATCRISRKYISVKSHLSSSTSLQMSMNFWQ
jgi:hypothetical protein